METIGKIAEAAGVVAAVSAIVEAVAVVFGEENAVVAAVLGPELEEAVGFGVPLVIGGARFLLGSGGGYRSICNRILREKGFEANRFEFLWGRNRRYMVLAGTAGAGG